MNPRLEEIDIESSNHSFRFIKIETNAFLPFWHYHPQIELKFVLHGQGNRLIGDSIESFSDNDLVLIGENVPHHWLSFDEHTIKSQQAYVFQFNADIFKPFKELDSFLDLFYLARKGIFFKNPSQKIIDLLTCFSSLNDFEKLVTLIRLIKELCSHSDKKLLCSSSYKSHYNKNQNIDKFSKVNNYILEHLGQKITIDNMADLTNMAPQSFCRWFKQISGYTFVTFLNKSRIEKACQTLLVKTKSIEQTAFSSGFESVSHFNRTFKRYKKKSPTEFIISRTNN